MHKTNADPADVVPGAASMARGDCAAAIRACNEALESDPRRGDVYCIRARAHRALGNLDQAVADATAAVRLEPRHAWAHRTLGDVHFAQGNVKAALACCDEAIRLDPSLAAAYNTRAAIRLVCGQLQAALADANQAILLNPKLWGAYITRGNTRYHLRDPGAVDDYLTSFQIDPEGHVRGIVSALAVQLRRERIFLFDNCAAHLRANPRDTISYVRRGLALLLLGKDDEAQHDLDQALRIKPSLLERVNLMAAEARRVRGSAPAASAGVEPTRPGRS